MEVDRFVAEGDAASLLGHGSVAVTSINGQGDWMTPADRRVFEAAVEDQLIHAGYDTLRAATAPSQIAEVTVIREGLAPAEDKRRPVSGEAAMSVGTGGTAYGLGLNIDLTKPRAALVSTRIEARILDKATARVLWEGRAQIATREGDGKWTSDAIASRLAAALFDGFGQPAPAPKS